MFVTCRYDTAVSHFTTCIELDSSNEVYYSNRAAAYTALKKYTEAIADSKEVVRLKPGWPRGWARLGAAYFGLKLYSEVYTVS
jgi:stress-induced-phosphoprotein 1